MIRKIRNFKFVIRNSQKGFSYVELIVVLSIFAIISSVSIFDYNSFQARVDIQNLANDIALQVLQAQSSALSGLQPPSGTFTNSLGGTGKPAYGVYFSTTSSLGADSTHFIYFADLNNDNLFSSNGCPGGECMSIGDFREDLDVFAIDVKRVQLRHKLEAMIHIIESIEDLEQIVTFIHNLH